MVAIGLRVPACRPVGEVQAFATEAEAAGYDFVWLPDSQLLWRDSFVTAAAIGHALDEAEVGIAVTNVRTRDTTVVASAARTVAELCPGRFVLGLGSGNSALRPLGLPLHTERELREAFRVLRDLGATGQARIGSREVALVDPGPAYPIYCAATGPGRLRLAGELADGVLTHVGTSAGRVRHALDGIAEGVARRGAELGEIEVTVSGMALPEGADLGYVMRPIILTMIQDGGGGALREVGLEAPDRVSGGLGELEGVDFKHAADMAGTGRLLARFVPDADVETFSREFTFAAGAIDLPQRIEELAALGVGRVFLQGIESFTLPEDLLGLPAACKAGALEAGGTA